MNKCLVVIFIAMGLTSCGQKNERFYLSHPKELQNALKACPGQAPQGLSCQDLDKLGTRINTLAYQLQSNPQGFGSKILQLEQTIGLQLIELKKDGTNKQLQSSLKQNQSDLTDYLAVVKWLESPES